MSTMWTPAPQRNVLRQQEYRRWVMTTEPRRKAPKPAPTPLPVSMERAADQSWQMARRALDFWAPRHRCLAGRRS
jgi:hypothetical protein